MTDHFETSDVAHGAHSPIICGHFDDFDYPKMKSLQLESCVPSAIFPLGMDYAETL